MTIRVTPLLPILFALWALPADAAQVVHADVVVHVTRVAPSHQLVEVRRFQVPYGAGGNTFGFVPRGAERLAAGPCAFDADEHGGIVVADPVRQKVFRVQYDGTAAGLTPVGDLPLPFADIGVDAAGRILVADLKSRTVRVLGSAAPATAVGGTYSMRFVRHGKELVVKSGQVRSLVRGHAVTPWSRRVVVEKVSAEAGLLTLGATGKKIQVEIGRPLASMRLIGVNDTGDIFLAVERFRQRGRIEVDRSVMVFEPAGRLKAKLDLTGQPEFYPGRDLVLGPRGELVRMVPGKQGVTFVTWEVR